MLTERTSGGFPGPIPATRAPAIPAKRSGADLAARHLRFDLALGLDVTVDLLAQLVRLRDVEVDLLLEDVREATAGDPHMIEVLHEHERVHRGEVAIVVHQLHGGIVEGCRGRTGARVRPLGGLSGARSSRWESPLRSGPGAGRPRERRGPGCGRS